jgi:tetratricopeptide (TPR) repeat protein
LRFSMLLVGIFAIAGSVLVSPAVADDVDTCNTRAGGDAAIAACTRIMQNANVRTPASRAMVYTMRGRVYQTKGELDRAIADYDEAIRLDPISAKAYSSRGTAYQTKGDRDRAITDYSEAIRLNPNDSVSYHNRGLAKRAKGDSAGGEADIAKAKQLDPTVGN